METHTSSTMSQQPPQSIRIPAPDFDPLSRPLFTPQSYLSSPGNNVPPALSPLDAFAMQSRLLQKKFEEQQMAGHRLSRLPATDIATEFGKPRPDFFRSMTSGSVGTQSAPGGSIDDEGPFGNLLEVRTGPRPKSHYPQMMSNEVKSPPPLPRTTPYELHLLDFVREAAQKSRVEPATTYWTTQRSGSPDDIDATPLAQDLNRAAQAAAPTSPKISDKGSPASVSSQSARHPRLLVPAGPPPVTTSPTRRPPRNFKDRNYNGVSHLSLASTSSTASMERFSPPATQIEFHVPRSPSPSSDYSRRSVVPRPSMNFSRPLSRQSRPSIDSSRRVGDTQLRQMVSVRTGQHPLDVSNRQDSMEVPAAPFKSEAPQTPVSVDSADFGHSDPKADSTPSSFVYQKYTLAPPRSEPRRVSARVSVGFEEFLNSQFTWDDGKADSSLDLQLSSPFLIEQRPPSPVLTDSPPSSRRRMRPADLLLRSTSISSGRTSGERTRRRLQKLRPGTSGTDRPRTATTPASPLTMDKVAQEHLDRGFRLFQAGDKEEAAYQWKLAATAGQGAGMLLYALACFHGWGIPLSAADSLMWLQSAVEHSSLQFADEEQSALPATQAVVTAERKDYKQHFALNVYELGMAYSNGWGVARNSPLALRCFEIAGNWGDGDAYAEAARHYLEGIGCKKDVRRAAQLYRIAESKGVAVPGNSWIHQERFIENDVDLERVGRETMRSDDKENRSRSKARSKSRTRALFSRKKIQTTD